MADELPEPPKEQQRTTLQNRAMHKYCQEVANECLDKGVDVTTVFQNVRVTPRMETIKMYWRGIAKALYGYESTTELTTTQIDKVYEEMHKILSVRAHINIPFPSSENSPEAMASYRE